MVGKEGANDRRPGRRAWRSLDDIAAARVVIERFVETEPAVHAEPRELLEVLGG